MGSKLYLTYPKMRIEIADLENEVIHLIKAETDLVFLSLSAFVL